MQTTITRKLPLPGNFELEEIGPLFGERYRTLRFTPVSPKAWECISTLEIEFDMYDRYITQISAQDEEGEKCEVNVSSADRDYIFGLIPSAMWLSYADSPRG